MKLVDSGYFSFDLNYGRELLSIKLRTVADGAKDYVRSPCAELWILPCLIYIAPNRLI